MDGRTSPTRAEGNTKMASAMSHLEGGDPPNRSWNNSRALERGRLREQRGFSSHNIPGCSVVLTVKAFIPLQLV